MNKLVVTFIFSLFTLTSGMAQKWETDITIAKELAAKFNRPIVLVFQGSDWCAPCIKLDREIWSSEVFTAYAKDHFVMLQADFPKKKKNALPESLQKQNNALAEIYNKQGIFPFVVVLDKKGKKLGETGYINTTPSEYIKHLESFK
ncbi:MAG: thioredoxin family protein [Altibacter sp.]|uniref:thioredoxin family protein n=1 Tax=Altibacter sp. TaxID=2024823 RepID=UPI001DAF8E12|nr:thioredoxin family protein [Altibacter sp.]MBZ0326949.1 thioredoxin family protein [Altibacter sp.]